MMGKEKEAVAQHPPAGTARTRARAVKQRPPDATSGESQPDRYPTHAALLRLGSCSHFESIAPDPHAVGSVNQALSRQIPPDLVVKFQRIDIIAVILCLVLQRHFVYQRDIKG